MWPALFQRLIRPLNDVLFDTTCYHCHLPLSDAEGRICSRCWSSLPMVHEGDHTLTILQQRFADGGVVDDVTALWYFEKRGPLQTIVHGLKYEGMTEFGFSLGRRISERLRHSAVDAVVPVPLNRRKLRERGYNQSEWIARGIGDGTGLHVSVDAVARVRYTETQTHLNADQRKANIAEAFMVTDGSRVRDRSFLIVDDIITTGSTIQEVARVLKASGASRVTVAAAGLARLGEDA